jgi:hypothetical protein
LQNPSLTNGDNLKDVRLVELSGRKRRNIRKKIINSKQAEGKVKVVPVLN